MDPQAQEIREQALQHAMELMSGQGAPLPLPRVAASGGKTTEVRVSAAGEVVVRVESGGGAAAAPGPMPHAIPCYIACYGAETNLLAGLTVSAEDERVLARIMGQTGVSRSALIAHLLSRLIGAEARRYEEEISGGKTRGDC